MTALQSIALGTAPAGSDGDTTRAANVKMNSNVAVLNAQAALTSAPGTITVAQALTAALHVGKRVNINLTVAGAINLPAASTCAADQVVLLRNVGTTIATLANTTGSSDTVALSKLNPGETALMDTDGVHAWNVLMRGRTNGDNEVVNGNCTVNGNETVVGTLGVTGLATLAGGSSFGATGQATISSAGAYSGVSAAYTGNVTVGGTLGVTGQATFALRPTFAGATPWDGTNLVGPMTLATVQTVTGAKNYTARVSVTLLPPTGQYTDYPVLINGLTGVAGIGLASNSAASIISIRCSPSGSAFEVVNYNSTGYQPITCSALTQTSDARLKSDVETLSGVMEKLRRLRGVSYVMGGQKSVGVIAQEVQSEFPELIVELGIEHEDGTPLLGVNYPSLVAPLLQGLLEQDGVITSLMSRIEALEERQS